MLSRVTPLTKNIIPRSNSCPNLGNKIYNNNPLADRRAASYGVHQTRIENTSYEQSRVNPLLIGNKGKIFQHPPIVRTTCVKTDCVDKLCEKPCDEVCEKVDVGHATHGGSYPSAVFISHKDLEGNTRAEYMVPYSKPIESTTSDVNIDINKTTNLNQNKEALNNVHMNSSKNSTQKASTGSDDISNIN